MKCSYHPESEATDICLTCRQPVCDQCTVKLTGKNYCRSCLEEKVVCRNNRNSMKTRFVAFLLSLVPGGGYFYLGLMKRGLQTMVIFFGSIFLGGISNLESLTAFVVPIMVFYSVFDTQQLLKKMNEGQSVEDKELFDWSRWESKGNIVGAALILFGIFALLNNVMPLFLNYHLISKIVPPLVILSVGVYILYRNTGRGGNQSGNDSR